MNVHDDKAEGGLGGSNSNAQGRESEHEPESKRIKLDDDDVDDPYIQHIEENQGDDDSRKPMEEALSDSSNYEPQFIREYEDPCAPFWDSDDDSKPKKMSAQETYMLRVAARVAAGAGQNRY